MKISINSVVFALALATGVSAKGSGNGAGLTQGNQGQGKGSNNVLVCHVPEGNPLNKHIIEVDENAVRFRAHIGPGGVGLHGGDYIVDDPKDCPNGVRGDPHFNTWTGDKYDFHGVCDLVLVENKNFKNGLGLDIHIRTSKVHQFSYVSAAVVRIGDDTLEVRGGKGANYWINGVAGDSDVDGNMWLPHNVGGYPVKVHKKNSKEIEYAVYLDDEQYVIFRTHGNYIRVDVGNPKEEYFGESVGLMGSFHTGERVGRDGITVVEDENEFGQQWQVRGNSYFHNIEGAQFPEKCMIPDASERRQRRLGEHTITEEEAEQACARSMDKDLCVFDVLALNDIEIAGAY